MATQQAYVEKAALFAEGCTEMMVREALANEFGTTAAEIDALQPLIDGVRAASVRAQLAEAEQGRATTALQLALKDVKGSVSKLRTAMNNNLKRNDPLFTQLSLSNKQPARQEDFIGYADKVFMAGTQLEASGAATMAKLKWDATRFAACRQQVETLRGANVEQETAKGNYATAIQDLYNQIDALDEVFRPLAKNARATFKKDAGKLETLGLKAGVPGKPARPVPGAARKAAPPTGQPTDKA